MEPAENPLHWVASSKRDLLDMPEPVVREIGIALSVAQFGSKHPNAKPWKGLGPGVLEAIYVLHCFQKKSPSGIRTAKTDVALVEQRLKAAEVDFEVRYGKTRK